MPNPSPTAIEGTGKIRQNKVLTKGNDFIKALIQEGFMPSSADGIHIVLSRGALERIDQIGFERRMKTAD